jgi:hypothetical protein
MDLGVRLEADATFPRDIDIPLIVPFLSDLPRSSIFLSSDLSDLLVGHYSLAREQFLKTASLLESLIADLSRPPPAHRFDSVTLTSAQKVASRRRANVFHCLLSSALSALTSARLSHARSTLSTIRELLKVVDWLLGNPRPLCLNFGPPAKNPLLFTPNRKVSDHTVALQVAFDEAATFDRTIPDDVFSVKKLNRQFLSSSIESAFASRKAETLYFESLPNEDNIYLFFQSSACPLHELGWFEMRPESICAWILRASEILSAFATTSLPEKAAILQILLSKFVFLLSYPDLRPRPEPSCELAGKIEAIRWSTAREVRLIEKFVPVQYFDRPVAELFQCSSIAKAPREWLLTVPFLVCPIDIGYVIFKAHEALTKMAILLITQAGGDSQAFFDNVPGFDDIFGHWVALLACADVPEPRATVEFLNTWSAMPGFPKRFLPCCAYFEAALAQIERFGEDSNDV